MLASSHLGIPKDPQPESRTSLTLEEYMPWYSRTGQALRCDPIRESQIEFRQESSPRQEKIIQRARADERP
jgi:hypothetical protein